MGIRNIITRLKMGRGDADDRFPYDENIHEAVIRCSICTGEQVVLRTDRTAALWV